MRKVTPIAGGALLIAAVFYMLNLRSERTLREPASAPRVETQSKPAQVPASPVEREFSSRAVPSSAAPLVVPPQELPHPHPITPQHERIYRENQLTFALDGAVDVEDVRGVRRLLAVYRQEFPEDSLALQQGYEIIADCLERPGEATRSAAQRFYDTELASTLRRHVRRHCLEKV